jgi:hypothetical protein
VATAAYITDLRTQRNKNFEEDHLTAYDSRDKTRKKAISGHALFIT